MNNAQNRPKVSVVIPVYNVEKYLTNCLDSVINQTFDNIEIIAVNDGSTDNSLKVLNSYAAKDSRIKIIDQQNQGLSGARNSGINASKGEFITFIDSDDTVEHNMLEELLQYAEKEDLDIVVYGYTKLYENGEIIAKPNFGDTIMNKDIARRASLSLKLSPMACNKLYKKELFTNTNVRFPLGFLHEDIGTTYKLFWNASRVGTISKSYYNWMVRGNSITGKFTRKHIEDIIFLLDEKKKFLMENDQFKTYKKEYIRAFFQIKTLLLERAMSAATPKDNILDYLLEKLKVHNTVCEENLLLFKKYDPQLYKKYILYNKKAMEINTYLMRDALLNLKKNEQNYNHNNFNNTHIPTKTSIYECLEAIKYRFFPVGSRRREMAQKLNNFRKRLIK